MEKFGIGQPVRRVEDVRFMTGQGRYTDDVNVEGQAYICYLRSPHAHAEITSMDTTAAKAAPGVVAVFTGADVKADKDIGTIPTLFVVEDRHGNPMYNPDRHPLCVDRVRFVGDLVAMVVAESDLQARDAAELIEVAYEELPAVADTVRAAAPGAPRVWPDCADNLCVHWENSDPAPVDEIFKSAPHVAKVDVVNNRVIGNPMEMRCAIGQYDADEDCITITAPSQGANRMHGVMTKIFDAPAEKIRIMSPDVGGGFGLRSKSYADIVLTGWAAKKLGRPVKWRGDRFETMVSDNHGRDNVTHAELAMDENGKALALKIEIIANMGAYLSEMGPRIPTYNGQRVSGTVYAIPHLYQSVKCVFSNTTPTDSYRGAGRPESAFVMERLMEAAAAEMGVDSIEIRKRNFIPNDAFPYTNTQGLVIDSGDFGGTTDLALKGADWDGFEARRAEAAKRGKRRGIGMGYFIESSGGQPQEKADVRFEPDGTVTIVTGTFSHGQGHETAYRQVIVDKLGIPFDKINYVHGGDTREVPFGRGTGGSRSSQMGGAGLAGAVVEVVEKGKEIAGHLMQTPPTKVSFERGIFIASGSDASVSIEEVAAAAFDVERLPDGMEPGLAAETIYERGPGEFNFPNGCHVAEVEVDPETGVVEVVRYTAVDDSGVIINPMIVHGQVHGGVAQGLGQALLEHTAYDDETGQFLTGSFMDYGMPRAAHFPDLNVSSHEVPCATNELGVKGAGEGGACGAPPAIVNAAIDAVKGLGVRSLDMPLTPERVWRAIQAAKAGA